MLLAALLVVVVVASGTGAIFVTVRRRTPPELRGDWWTPFEREFRAYARQAARRAPRRHRGGAA